MSLWGNDIQPRVLPENLMAIKVSLQTWPWRIYIAPKGQGANGDTQYNELFTTSCQHSPKSTSEPRLNTLSPFSEEETGFREHFRNS